MLGNWIGRVLGGLGTVAVWLFLLTLPLWSGYGTYNAVREADALQAALTLLAEAPAPAVADLAALPTGRDVVIEGTISERTPTLFEDTLVIVIHERQVTTINGSRWQEQEPTLQPLLLNVGEQGERVQIEGPRRDATDAAYAAYGLEQRFNDSSNRWYGLVHGERVFVFGRVVQSSEQPYLDATVVCAGNRTQCDAILRRERNDTLVGGFILGMITVVLGIFALVLLVWGLRTAWGQN